MNENAVLLLYFLAAGLSITALVLLAKRIRAQKVATRWPVILGVNVLIFMSLVFLLCLGGEIYFRFWYDTTDSLMYSKVTKRWFDRYWVKNANGVRDNVNYAYEREPGKRRVTFLGDSFTGGHGVMSVEDRFANIIRREHPDWEVHVLAVPGYDTGDQLKLLHELLQKGYDLDLVVLVYCLNDISDLLPKRHEALQAVEREVASRPWLVKHSYFLDMVAHRINVRRNPFMRGYFDLVREAYGGPDWQTQKARLAALQKAVEGNGGHVAVVTFPFLQALGGDYAYTPVHELLGAYWREQNVPHLDLLGVYAGMDPGKITVNAYDAHPNEHAHSLAARAISPFIEQQLKVQRELRRSER